MARLSSSPNLTSRQLDKFRKLIDLIKIMDDLNPSLVLPTLFNLITSDPDLLDATKQCDLELTSITSTSRYAEQIMDVLNYHDENNCITAETQISSPDISSQLPAKLVIKYFQTRFEISSQLTQYIYEIYKIFSQTNTQSAFMRKISSKKNNLARSLRDFFGLNNINETYIFLYQILSEMESQPNWDGPNETFTPSPSGIDTISTTSTFPETTTPTSVTYYTPSESIQDPNSYEAAVRSTALELGLNPITIMMRPAGEMQGLKIGKYNLISIGKTLLIEKPLRIENIIKIIEIIFDVNYYEELALYSQMIADKLSASNITTFQEFQLHGENALSDITPNLMHLKYIYPNLRTIKNRKKALRSIWEQIKPYQN